MKKEPIFISVVKKAFDEKIDEVFEKLYQFSKTRAFDSGVKLAETERELLTWKRAKRLFSKCIKNHL